MALVFVLLLQSLVERAESLLREHNVAEAKAAVTAALAQQPDSVPALMLRGRIAMAESDFDAARTALTKAASLRPNAAAPQFLLGFLHYVDNDFQQARPALERARKLNPRDPQSALFLALTYDGLALPDLAGAAFEDALKLEAAAGRPSAGTRVAYARMLHSLGRHEEAQAHITKALVIDGSSRDAHYEQARLHLHRAQHTDAIAAATRALELPGEGTTDRSIHFLLSQAYARSGDKERADVHRKRFESIPPRLIR
jgi:tetratricopeptide (TPR) repeat protein